MLQRAQFRTLGGSQSGDGARHLAPQWQRGAHRPVLVCAMGTNDEVQSGWSTRELLLLSEMVATRQQVDRLIEQQNMLIQMVAASHPALAHMQFPTPSPPRGISAERSVSPSMSGSPAPSAAIPDSSALNSVAQLLGNLNAPLGGQRQLSSSLQAALKLVEEGDVLTQNPISKDTQQGKGKVSPAPVGGGKDLDMPVLTKGARNSFWMEKLHVALLARGYYCGDDDVQSWTFGEGTRKALSQFQENEQLPNSGIADQATWTALLAEIPELRQDIQEAMLTGKAPTMQGKADTAAKAPTQTPTPKRSAPAPTPQASKPQPNKISSRPPSRPAQSSPVSDQTLRARAYYSTEEDTGPSFNPSFANFDNEEPMPLDALDAYYAGAGATDTSARDGGSVPPKTAVDNKPPRMVSGDVGGFFMDTVHTALMRAGFNPSFREVDLQEFGKTTLVAVKGFQDAKGLPITGEVDDATWAYLLKDESDLRSAFIQAVATGGAQDNTPPTQDTQQGSGNGTSNGNGVTAKSSEGRGRPPTPKPQRTDAKQTDEIKAAIEGEKQGTLPSLSRGDDDIMWVSRLQRALVGQGFYPSDEECEEWLFGEATQEAVLSAQASGGLPETGVVCVSTWRWLLRESDNPVRVEIEEAVGPYDTWGTEVHTEVKVTAAPKSTATESSSDPWPVLREGDNEGLPVAVLQKALGAAGYHCGDDEGQWWMFGPDTTNALKTFQVCLSLPETGVCDVNTWKALVKTLGLETKSVTDLKHYFQAISPDGEDPFVDLSGQQKGRVWLLGEQRWEQRA